MAFRPKGLPNPGAYSNMEERKMRPFKYVPSKCWMSVILRYDDYQDPDRAPVQAKGRNQEKESKRV